MKKKVIGLLMTVVLLSGLSFVESKVESINYYPVNVAEHGDIIGG